MPDNPSSAPDSSAPQSVAPLSHRAGSRFIAAVGALFGVSGMALANWFPRIPETRAALGLSYDQLGLALFAVGGGAMLSMPIAGWLIGRIGSFGIVRAMAVGMCLSLPLVALASSLPALAGALLLFGMLAGATDVAMNAQAAHGEHRTGRVFLSMLHGVFSLGALLGAATGAGAAALGMPLDIHLGLVAIVLLATVLVANRFLLPDRGGSAAVAPAFALPHGALWWLGLIAFSALLVEGAVADWSAVFLRDVYAAGPQAAATGFVAFSLTMAAGRLAGDRVDGRIGSVRLLRLCGVLAAIGMGLALAGGGTWIAVFGFALVGVGNSVVFPIMIRRASRLGTMGAGAGIAAVATAGYTGLLTGPPVIGLVAEQTGLRVALTLLVVLSLAIAVLAARGRAPQS